MKVFIVKEGKEMKAKQVLEMSDRLKTKREIYEILLQKRPNYFCTDEALSERTKGFIY